MLTTMKDGAANSLAQNKCRAWIGRRAAEPRWAADRTEHPVGDESWRGALCASQGFRQGGTSERAKPRRSWREV